MTNHYFRFKKFIIYQDRCAMKVCTDSCLFGAWCADWLLKNKSGTKHILDIGTGTGLLSLQLAQKINNAVIDAVEINTEAAVQAKGNFDESFWKDQLYIHYTKVQEFFSDQKYDFIICNPPFYNNDLRGDNKARNIAHHNTELTFNELIKALQRLLGNDGDFAILLPYHRTKEFENIAIEGAFYPKKKTLVKQTEGHNFFRSMVIFSKQKKVLEEDEIFIKSNTGEYSTSFIHLLKDYYLYL